MDEKDKKTHSVRFMPRDEPVTGAAIERLNTGRKLSGLDVNYAYGLSSASYQRSVMQHDNVPVENISLALLARYYEAAPDLLEKILIPTPTPYSVFEKIRKEVDLSPRQFAILLGRSASYAVRAVKEDFDLNRSTPIARLLFILDQDIEEHGAANALNRLRALAQSEAKARGVEASFEKKGTWTESGAQKTTVKPTSAAKTNRTTLRAKPAQPALVTVQLAGRLSDGRIDMLTTPVPGDSAWKQPEFGLLGKFGTWASVLDTDIINYYHMPIANDFEYGPSVPPTAIHPMIGTFDFHEKPSASRSFGPEDRRRWLDLRSMSKELSKQLGEILKVPGFTSWAMKNGTLSPQAKNLLNPAEFEHVIPLVEELLGPLDLILFPQNAQKRMAPVYAWVRRKECLTSITGRGLPEETEVNWEGIRWAKE